MNKLIAMFFIIATSDIFLKSKAGHCVEGHDPDRISFIGRFHDNDKFITILAMGNGTTRNAHLTVYEVLPNFQLRRLSGRFLLNQCKYTYACLCVGGRFLVTTNQSSWDELTHALVIYDLVRNEQTAYEVEELFSPDQQLQIKKLHCPKCKPRAVLVEWSQPLVESDRHLDAKNLSFTIHSVGLDFSTDMRMAQDLLKVESPFLSIVIDLPTRAAKTLASSTLVDLRPKPQTEPWDTNKHAYVNCDDQSSTNDAIYDKSRNRILLPRLMEVHFTNPEGRRLYQLDSETQEYSAVDTSDARVTKQIDKVCSADRDVVKQRVLEQLEAARKLDEDEGKELTKSDSKND